VALVRKTLVWNDLTRSVEVAPIPQAHLPATTKRAIVALFASRSGKLSWPSSPR